MTNKYVNDSKWERKAESISIELNKNVQYLLFDSVQRKNNNI